MKVILILAGIIALGVARPQETLTPGVVPILDYQFVTDELGQYGLSFVTGDGTKITEQGALVPNDDGTGNVLIKKGSSEYFAPDGTPVKTEWTADASGYHAEGPHIPKTPASLPAAEASA